MGICTGYEVSMKCMPIQAKKPIRPPNKAPVSAIAIIRDDRVLTLTRDPMPSPMSVQPRPARKASLIASGSFSGDTAEWVGEDSSEKKRTILAAMNARPAITGMIERSLDTATKDN
jgi:hypothetical protein